MERIASAVLRLFAATSASTVVLLRRAIASSVSPARTVYVFPPAAGVAAPAAEAPASGVAVAATGDESAVRPDEAAVAAGVAVDGELRVAEVAWAAGVERPVAEFAEVAVVAADVAVAKDAA